MHDSLQDVSNSDFEFFVGCFALGKNWTADCFHGMSRKEHDAAYVRQAAGYRRLGEVKWV